MTSAPENPKPTLATKFAAAPNKTAKASEAQSSQNPPRVATAARQSSEIPSNANSDGLKSRAAQSGITSKIAMPPSSADPVKAPGAAVVVGSKTHFVPEAAKAGDSVAREIATASSAQNQAAAPGQVTFPSSRKQLNSELSNSNAAPGNDAAPKVAAPASAPNQTDPSQTVAFAPSRTTAGATSTEQRSNMTTDGSSFADTQAENPENSVSASRLNVTPYAGGGNSQDGSAKDKASHNHPSDGPVSASAEVPRSSEVSLAIPPGRAARHPRHRHNKFSMELSALSQRPLAVRPLRVRRSPRSTVSSP